MNADELLVGWFRQAQEQGLIGPGDVRAHLAHAERFFWALDEAVTAWDGAVGGIDLGSGAGIPGLALAVAWPETTWTLVDGRTSRAAALQRAVRDLGLTSRVTVLGERAEDLARQPTWREQAAVVVARSFGPPATTAECAAGLLRLGGTLAVSEPPRDCHADGRPEEPDADRWPSVGLAGLGLAAGERRDGIQLVQKVGELSDRFPRRVGQPAKRPLF